MIRILLVLLLSLPLTADARHKPRDNRTDLMCEDIQANLDFLHQAAHEMRTRQLNKGCGPGDARCWAEREFHKGALGMIRYLDWWKSEECRDA